MRHAKYPVLVVAILLLATTAWTLTACKTPVVETPPLPDPVHPEALPLCGLAMPDDDTAWRQVWRAGDETGGVNTLLRDGDWLWVATPVDLVRLDLRTLDCTRFDLGGVRDLLRDGDWLWVATPGDLVRLDVHTLDRTHFELDNVRSLLAGPRGRLWATGSTGLIRFDGRRWQTVLANLYVYDIAFDGSGNLWIYTSWLGYRGLVWVRYPGLEPPENGSWEGEVQYVQYPLQDVCDRWTAQSGQFRSSGECRLLESWRGRLALQAPPEGIAPWAWDQPIAAESDERLWALGRSHSDETGRYDTLLGFDGQEWRALPWPYGAAPLVADDARRGVWAGTSEGLIFSDGRSIQKYLLTPGDAVPTGPPVRDLVVDGSGRLWALTGRGLLRYDETADTWQTIQASEQELLISADDRGGLWVMPRDLSGRVSYFDGETWTHHHPPGWPCLPESILADAGGGLWASSHGCALRGFDGEVWDEYDNGSRGDRLFRGPDGTVYAVGQNGSGVRRYDGDGWEALPPACRGRVIDLVAGPRGEVWVACSASPRLLVYRDGEWEQVLEADESISALMIDSQGDLWAAHGVGLLRYDGKELARIESGFPLGEVRAIVQDRQGRIWVGGEHGLGVYDPAGWEQESVRTPVRTPLPATVEQESVRTPVRTPLPATVEQESVRTPVRTPLPATVEQWEMATPISLDCWKHEAGDPPWQHWRNVGFSDIKPGGLVTDGDLLWISTHQGLFRLDVRTLECTGFPKVDQFSLTEGNSFLPTGEHLLLPDGKGGLWLGSREGILRFSDGEWQVASQFGRTVEMHVLGLRRTGNLCAEIQWWRTNALDSVCFNSTIPLTGELRSRYPFDFTNCDQWQRVTWRGLYYADDHDSFYNYTTAAECEQMKMTLDNSPIAVSPSGDETWMMRGMQLLHRRGETTEQVKMPYQNVQALAVDSVNGGVWLATKGGLVHDQVNLSTAGEPTHSVFQPFLLNQQTIPGSTYSVVVDKSDQVWAVSWRYSDDTRYLRDYKLLRYSESDQTWYPLASIADRVDAVTADPVRGVWIAWFDGLSYFDGTRQRTWPAPDFPDRMPTSLLVDEDGRVWMGTIQGGVWTMLPQARSTEDTDNARSRSIWHRFTITDGLESQLIMALAQGPDGRIYAAHAAGISVLDPSEGVENGRWVTLPGSNVKPKKWVNTLVFAQAGGGLWVSHYYHSSLWHYRDGRWTEYRLPLEFERRYYTGGHDYHRAVQSIGRLLVDEDGTLWVGTIKGLWRWPAAGDGGEARWQTFDSSTLTMRDVTTLAQDSRGRIWVGGEEGIAMWDGGR